MLPISNTEPSPEDQFTKIPILVSYHYCRGKTAQRGFEELLANEDVELLLDSGAFSAFNAGAEIHLEEYLDFLRTYGDRLFGYMALDKLQDPVQTAKNLIEMKKAGLSPIPIHVFGNRQEEMDDLFRQSTYVALGGFRRPHRGPAPRSYVVEKMKWAKGRRVHWLGYTNNEMVAALRPYSVDSSNWSRGILYGIMVFYVGKGRIHPIPRYSTQGTKGCVSPITLTMSKALQACEIDESDFRDDRQWRNVGPKYLAGRLGALAYIRASQYIRRTIGTRCFLAINPHPGSAEPRTTIALKAASQFERERLQRVGRT